MKSLHSAALLLLFAFGASADTLEFGLKTTYYNYRESNGTALLDTETADLGKIAGGYLRFNMTLRENSAGDYDRFELYASRTAGTTLYTGSVLGSGMPYGSLRSRTADIYEELQFNLTRSLRQDALLYTIKAGVGYYEWERELSTSQVEVYSWNYVQLGIGVSQTFGRDWEIAMDLSGHYGVNRTMEADFTGVEHLQFDLGRVYTVRAGVPLTIPVKADSAVLFRLEYEYTKIGQSNVVSAYYEPEDRVRQWYEPDSQQQNWHFYTGVVFDF
jgi:hypothetical protein